ncbi:MAG: SRPBCC family protein [Vicinamibacterales bacterium]
MKDYSVSVQIAAPPATVWGVMSDIERWHEWTPSITSVRRTNAGPFRIGARARVEQPRLPAADWIVTALHEGRGFDWESRAPGVRVLARHVIEPTVGGSRVTLSVQYSGIFGDLIGRLTASLNRRYIALEADGLKRRAEAHGAGA